MKELRIYTRKMAQYLTSCGFNYIRTIQDITKPQYLNWIFPDTPELRAAMSNFKE